MFITLLSAFFSKFSIFLDFNEFMRNFIRLSQKCWVHGLPNLILSDEFSYFHKFYEFMKKNIIFLQFCLMNNKIFLKQGHLYCDVIYQFSYRFILRLHFVLTKYFKKIWKSHCILVIIKFLSFVWGYQNLTCNENCLNRLTFW